jgi:hypothetical protein
VLQLPLLLSTVLQQVHRAQHMPPTKVTAASAAVAVAAVCIVCSVAAGALYPAYATYKSLVVPKRAAAASPRGNSNSSAASVHSLEAQRWLKYWALFGLTVVAERMLDQHLDRWAH